MKAAANFFTDLKRRNVYKVAIAYALVGWLLVQVATQVFPFFEIPARQILARLTELAKTRYLPAYAFAVVYMAPGEKDQVLDWLEKNVRDHASPTINLITIDPYFDPLRGEPRFQALVSQVLSGSVK